MDIRKEEKMQKKMDIRKKEKMDIRKKEKMQKKWTLERKNKCRKNGH